jgi:hypothetical protein
MAIFANIPAFWEGAVGHHVASYGGTQAAGQQRLGKRMLEEGVAATLGP